MILLLEIDVLGGNQNQVILTKEEYNPEASMFNEIVFGKLIESINSSPVSRAKTREDPLRNNQSLTQLTQQHNRRRKAVK